MLVYLNYMYLKSSSLNGKFCLPCVLPWDIKAIKFYVIINNVMYTYMYFILPCNFSAV